MRFPTRLLTLLAALVLVGGGLAGPAGAQGSGGSGEPSQWFFEVDALNAGLGAPGGRIDRDTPQGALETFMRLADGSRPGLERAAHLLDLSDIPPDRQATVGPILAGQLEEVISRKIWLDWGVVTDRPDGLSAAGGSDDPLAGEPRRSIRLGLLDLDGRPVPIRLDRVRPEEGDPVWVFSAQTVENVPALFERYGPTALERAIPDALKGEVVLGLALWELIALPVVLGLAALAGIATHRLFRALSRRASGGLLSDVVEGAALPAATVMAAFVGSVVTARVFTFSAPIDAFLAPALTALVAIAVLLAAVHTIDLVIDHTLADDVEELEKPENEDRRRFQTNISAARRVGLVVAFVAAIGLFLMQSGVADGVGLSLLGSAGLVTLILAYAGRTALSNIMASLQIAVSKSARIGDAVLWQGHWCYVEKINFTYVQLKSWDQRRLIVPVNAFVSETFENWTKRDPSLVKTVELRLNHAADVDALRARFEAWVEGRDDIVDRDEAKVQVIGHDATGMELRFYATGPNPSAAWDMQCALREAMLKAAAELEPHGTHGGTVLPAEREAKIADFTGQGGQREARGDRGRDDAGRDDGREGGWATAAE